MIALEKFDFHVPNVSIRNELLKRFDHDGDGSINYLEFVNFCLAYAMNNDDEGVTSTTAKTEDDTIEHAIRLKISHYLETNGGVTSLSTIFIVLNDEINGREGIELQLFIDYLTTLGTSFTVDEIKYMNRKFKDGKYFKSERERCIRVYG
jgi:hypothetical protein